MVRNKIEIKVFIMNSVGGQYLCYIVLVLKHNIRIILNIHTASLAEFFRQTITLACSINC